MQFARYNNGVSLIEVLITSVIISVGLLCIARLQIEEIKTRHNSELELLASIQASEIIERMKANMVAVTDKDYDMKTTSPIVNQNCLGGAANGSLNYNAGSGSISGQHQFTTASCTPKQMAQNDMQEWINSLNQTLPNGDGYICLTDNPGAVGSALSCNGAGNLYVISVTWRNKEGGQNEFRISFQP